MQKISLSARYIKILLIFVYILGITLIISAIVCGNILLNLECKKSEITSMIISFTPQVPEEYSNFIIFSINILKLIKNMESDKLYPLIFCFSIIGITLIVTAAVLQWIQHRYFGDLPESNEYLKNIELRISKNQFRYINEVMVERPYFSPFILIIILYILPFLIVGIPFPQNYIFIPYYFYLFFFIFLTFIASFILPVIFLKHRYTIATDSLEKNKKANFNLGYVLGIYLLSTIYSIPLLINFITISDFSLGGFGFGIGLFTSFLLSIGYLERPFRKLENKRVILYIHILENNLILADNKLPVISTFKIHGNNFEKIKKIWNWIFFFMIFPPIQLLLTLFQSFVCKYLILEIYYAIFFIIYIILFVVPFKKQQKVNWIIKEFHDHSVDIKTKLIKS